MQMLMVLAAFLTAPVQDVDEDKATYKLTVKVDGVV